MTARQALFLCGPGFGGHCPGCGNSFGWHVDRGKSPDCVCERCGHLERSAHAPDCEIGQNIRARRRGAP